LAEFGMGGRILPLPVCGGLAVLCASAAGAGEAQLPRFEIVATEAPKPMPFSISPALRPEPAFEGPPILVTSANSTAYFVNTGWTWLCRASGNFLTTPQTVGPANCAYFTGPSRVDPKTGAGIAPAAVAQKKADWDLSYGGAMSVVTLQKPLDGFDHIAAVHGENKNERFGDTLYANTVNPEVKPQDCASGYAKGGYEDCWKAYNAFVSLLLFNAETGAKRDLGPVVWPVMGYIHAGKKSSNGVRQPSLYLAEPYLYIYYSDSSQGYEAERRAGLRVARIDLSRPDAATAPVALPYTHAGLVAGNPSLPAGFDKQAIGEFYPKAGGHAAELWPESWKTACFRVARIKDTPYYLGVEDSGDASGWGVRLRISADLVHWSNPAPDPGVGADYNSDVLHCAVPTNAAGDSQDMIDAADFYLLGSTVKATATRQRLSLRWLK
jgi:hypothetical protein